MSAALLSITALFASTAFADNTTTPSAANSAGLQGPWVGKDFDELDQAEIDAARQAARNAHFPTLRVCADPGNMPLSDRAREGYQNKILEVLAKAMGARLSYYWRAYTGDLVGQAFGTADECDLLMDMPVEDDDILATMPIYRTSYVLVWRNDEKLSISSLDDPRLRHLRVGVFQISALRQALSDHGVVANVKVWHVSSDTEWVPAHQPWRQVQEVVDGKLDVAAAWGPMAGWLKTMKRAPITIQPTNLMDNSVPMEFSLGIGVPKQDVVLKFALDDALKAHRAEIEGILRKYGVPMVKCADCLIPGDLPAHGSYMTQTSVADSESKPTHWSVSRVQVDKWLAEGSSANKELDDAVIANDVDRAAYLIGKGASVNALDNLGTPPLVTAARAGCIEMMQLLIAHGAKVDRRDGEGATPLMGAAERNQAAAIRFLVAHGASTEKGAPRGYTPLSLAIEEQQFDAAYTLIEAGADVNTAASKYRLTPLMVVASEPPPGAHSLVRVLQNHGPMDVARALLAHKAKVNATDTEGVTALMIAAAHDNSPMIALLIQSGANPAMKSAAGETARDIAVKNDNLGAIRILSLLVRR
ncbi:MAG: quinoprotein dehydrogenase-associated putative ABC transporter substrate-binding protein [Gammaproteobacteria bacterium]|nr:quinoprotein dehydrogenase-associated putative ABC transporter substrate-binding protein [Gammaproteobacteria bacterium]